MTVAELIELLKQQPQAVKVVTEGCDCYGDAVDVEFHGTPDNPVLDVPADPNAYVLITRQ